LQGSFRYSKPCIVSLEGASGATDAPFLLRLPSRNLAVLTASRDAFAPRQASRRSPAPRPRDISSALPAPRQRGFPLSGWLAGRQGAGAFRPSAPAACLPASGGLPWQRSPGRQRYRLPLPWRALRSVGVVDDSLGHGFLEAKVSAPADPSLTRPRSKRRSRLRSRVRSGRSAAVRRVGRPASQKAQRLGVGVSLQLKGRKS
jgi:hypothetical protein